MKCSDFCYQNWCLQNVQSYLSNNPRIPNHKQHFNLPCPLTSPYPTQKKTLKTTRPVPPNWKKNRSNINLAVKVFTHPHSSFPNSYISHTWSETAWIDWFNSHGFPTNLPKLDPPIPSVQKAPPGPWLLKLSRHSLSFAALESSTPPPCEGGEDFGRCPSGYQLVDGRDGTGWSFFLFKRWWNDGKTAKMQVISKV